MSNFPGVTQTFQLRRDAQFVRRAQGPENERNEQQTRVQAGTPKYLQSSGSREIW